MQNLSLAGTGGKGQGGQDQGTGQGEIALIPLLHVVSN